MVLVLEWKEASENVCSGWLFKMWCQNSGVLWQQNFKNRSQTTTLPVYSACADAVKNPQHLFSLEVSFNN